MKKALSVLLLYAAAIVASPAQAALSAGELLSSDEATIEVTQIRSCAIARQDINNELAAYARISCSTKQGIEGFLNVTKITTSMISLGAACTPAGAPVVVAAGISGIATEMISLIVSNLDCEDSVSDRKLDALVKLRVCSALQQKGIACRPEDL